MGLFEKHCQAICGSQPAETSGILEAWHRTLNEFAQAYGWDNTLEGKSIPIEVGFVDDPTYNAWACTIDHCDLIGINIGVLYILHGAFRALLSQPGVLPNIGDPTIPQEPYHYKGALEHIAFTPDEWLFPPLNDPAREQHAKELAKGGVLYVLFHELAHVINGHTSWISTNGFKAILERPLTGSPAHKGVLAQTLEYDADSAAVNSLLFACLRPEVDDSSLPTKWSLPEKNGFGTVDDALRAVAITVEVAHLFFLNAEELDSPTALQETHPPTIVRRQYSLYQIINVMHVRSCLDEAKTATTVFNAALAAVNSFLGMMSEQESKKIKAIIRSTIEPTKIEAFIELYLETWKELRPQLDPLKRAGSLAPIRPW